MIAAGSARNPLISVSVSRLLICSRRLAASRFVASSGELTVSSSASCRSVGSLHPFGLLVRRERLARLIKQVQALIDRVRQPAQLSQVFQCRFLLRRDPCNFDRSLVALGDVAAIEPVANKFNALTYCQLILVGSLPAAERPLVPCRC